MFSGTCPVYALRILKCILLLFVVFVFFKSDDMLLETTHEQLKITQYDDGPHLT